MEHWLFVYIRLEFRHFRCANALAQNGTCAVFLMVGPCSTVPTCAVSIGFLSKSFIMFGTAPAMPVVAAVDAVPSKPVEFDGFRIQALVRCLRRAR